jgi:hypothetical protein
MTANPLRCLRLIRPRRYRFMRDPRLPGTLARIGASTAKMKLRWPVRSAVGLCGFAKITWINRGAARAIVKTLTIAGRRHALSSLQLERLRAQAENSGRVPESFRQPARVFDFLGPRFEASLPLLMPRGGSSKVASKLVTANHRSTAFSYAMTRWRSYKLPMLSRNSCTRQSPCDPTRWWRAPELLTETRIYD